MKLYRSVSMFGLGVSLLGIVAATACSSSDTGSTGTGGSKGRQPPAAPAGAAAAGADERTFALNNLQLGEADRNGVSSKDAWKDFGFDLDGLTTTKDSKDVCTRAAGASSSNQEDGNQGIDNAFGHVIIPFLQPFTATPSKTISDAIAKGDFTILMKIKGLTDDAAQTNTGLSGTLLVGGAYSEDGKTAPAFDKTTDWPYRADPQVAITGAYINNGTFVNGEGGADVQLALDISGITLTLTIHKAIITFDHKSAGELTNGNIAGVINTSELIDGIKKVAGHISDQLCGGSTLDSVTQTIQQSSDILTDGTNKAGVNCDSISIGIGFTAKEVANPTKTAAAGADSPDKCAGGADAGAGDGG